MLDKPHLVDEPAPTRGLWGWYQAVPLYLRILVGMALGIALGLALGEHAHYLGWISKIILRVLGALAPALILVAVMDSILGANLPARAGGKLAGLLILNTLVAIFIGLGVANLVQPGKHEHPTLIEKHAAPDVSGLGEQLLSNIPRSVGEPLVNNNVIGVVILAVVFAIALRGLRATQDISLVNQLIRIAFSAIVVVLHWIISLVPLAVLATVAEVVGTKGFAPLKSLAWFIAAVIVALLLQAGWYLVRIRFWSWVSPGDVLRGTRDALVMAFSTASSTATMPVTYACLRDNVGLREESASLGALVGANFNNDGTALYEAMAALFVAQMIGVELTVAQQMLVVGMSVVASVGAAGIPEAGLVTMTLVFDAVHLPKEYIFLLLPVDWFLDRCRTAINVLGDVNVSCMMEGTTRSDPTADTPLSAEELVAERETPPSPS